MKLARNKLFKLNNLLKVLKDKKNTKFAYMVLKNTKTIDEEIDIVKGLVKLPDEHKSNEFEAKRIELIKKWANKDEQGNPVIKNNNYDVSEENIPKFNVEYDELVKEYADALAEVELNNQKLQDLLAEEIEIELRTITEDNLPDDLSAEELDALEPIII